MPEIMMISLTVVALAGGRRREVGSSTTASGGDPRLDPLTTRIGARRAFQPYKELYLFPQRRERTFGNRRGGNMRAGRRAAGRVAEESGRV